MNKYLLLALGFMLLSCNALSGQTTAAPAQPMLLLQEESVPTTPLSSSIKVSPNVFPQRSVASTPPAYLSSLTLSSRSSPAASPQPLCYSAADLAFFCRLEVKIESATRMPVRFRLGDVQQVDYLEGKFTGWRYGY